MAPPVGSCRPVRVVIVETGGPACVWKESRTGVVRLRGYIR